MAELILSDEEKKAASYLDFDDASLGACVKSMALILGDVYGKDALYMCGASSLLIRQCIDTNADNLTSTVEGMTVNGKQCGDWEVSIRRIKEPKE